MAYTDPILGLTSAHTIGDSGWGAANNVTLDIIRAMLLPNVLGIANDESTPSDGDFYIVGTSATGEYLGQDNKLAVYDGTDWYFVIPPQGTIKFNQATGQNLKFSGSAWTALDSRSKPIVSAGLTGAVNLNLSVGDSFITDGATGNVTLTVSNVELNGITEFNYVFIQDGTGSRTLTFPTGTQWDGGIIPTATAAANAEDEYKLTTRDGGTTWKGFIVGQNFS